MRHIYNMDGKIIFLETNTENNDQEILARDENGNFRTLSLLSIDTIDGKIFFVDEGTAHADSLPEINEQKQYWYEENTCPTNFIRIAFIIANGDTDQHGLFKHERTAWMTQEYVSYHDQPGHSELETRDMLKKIFPEAFQNKREKIDDKNTNY